MSLSPSMGEGFSGLPPLRLVPLHVVLQLGDQDADVAVGVVDGGDEVLLLGDGQPDAAGLDVDDLPPGAGIQHPPADGRGGVIVAAIHVLSPFVSPEAVVGMAIYTAKAMLYGKGNDRWEMLVENVPQPSERSGARRRITKTRRPFDARERARRSLRSNQRRCEAADPQGGMTHERA